MQAWIEACDLSNKILHQIKTEKKGRFGIVSSNCRSQAPPAISHVKNAQPTQRTQPRGTKQVRHCDFAFVMPAKISCVDAGIAIARDNSRAELIRLPNARELPPARSRPSGPGTIPSLLWLSTPSIAAPSRPT